MHTSIFVTGTDTDIGKTFISALLVKAWKCNYWKPIQTGLNEDPGDTATVERLLTESGGIPESTTIFKPALEYQKPLSPWRCTVLEKENAIDLSLINLPRVNNNSITVVEGAGGVLVPITKDATTVDLIKHLEIPVLVVARPNLGTLNHTLMTLETLKHNDIKVLGVVLNGDINEDNASTLKELGVKILAQIPLSKNLNDAVDLIPSLYSIDNDL